MKQVSMENVGSIHWLRLFIHFKPSHTSGNFELLASDIGHRQLFELLRSCFNELIVRVVGVVLDELREVVSCLLRESVNPDDVPLNTQWNKRNVVWLEVHGLNIFKWLEILFDTFNKAYGTSNIRRPLTERAPCRRMSCSRQETP